MKKYAFAALLFIFNNEILSWIGLVIIAIMLFIAFLRESAEGGAFD